MNKKEIFSKVQEIFIDVFDDENLEINNSTNSEDIEEWDSLNHIQLVLSIENLIPWPAAENIEIILTTNEDQMTIENEVMIIGSIASGDTVSNNSTPFIISSNIDAEIRDYSFTVFFVGEGIDGSTYSDEYNININVRIDQANFPILSEFVIVGSPLVIDIDNQEQELEIVYADNAGYIHIVNHLGEERVGWPFNTGDDI